MKHNGLRFFLLLGLALSLAGCDYAKVESNTLTAQGMKYYNQGNAIQAMNAFRTAITKDPNNDQPLYRLAQLEITQHNYDEAKSHLESCISLRPDVAEYYYMLGTAQYEEAMSLPDTEDAQISKERLLTKCIASFKQTVDLDPAYAEAHLRLGRCYLANDQFEEAVLAFEASIKENPHLISSEKNGAAVAFKELGMLYANYGFYDKAIAVFSSGIQHNLGDFQLEIEFANVLQDMERYEEAVMHYETAYSFITSKDIDIQQALPAMFGAGMTHYQFAMQAAKQTKTRESNDEYEKAQKWFKRFVANAATDDVRAQKQAANAYITEIDKILKNGLEAEED